MTKHRQKDDWIADILEAAALEVDQHGHTALTMAGVAARTGLSKGGVYRFFANKQALLVALLRYMHAQAVDFDVAEAISWDLPRPDTLFRVFVQRPTANARRAARNHRVWTHLLSLSLFDDAVRREQRRVARSFEAKCVELAEQLLVRDGVALTDARRAAVRAAVHMGMVLRDGAAVRNAAGASVRDIERVGQLFIRVVGDHISGASGETQ